MEDFSLEVELMEVAFVVNFVLVLGWELGFAGCAEHTGELFLVLIDCVIQCEIVHFIKY